MTKLTHTVAVLVCLAAAPACFETPADPPHYGAFLPLVIVAQVEGLVDPRAGGPSTIGLIRPFVAGPQMFQEGKMPDLITSQGPPFCVGFQFDRMRPPNLFNGDAGDISITGLQAGEYIDLTTGEDPFTLMPAPVPTEVSCSRSDFFGTLPYNCNVPGFALIASPEPWLATASQVTIRAAGGTNVGVFSETQIVPPPPATAAAGFDPSMVDVSAPVTVSWNAPEANWVMIELFGQLQDGSAIAQLLCLEPADSGQKSLPSEGLALMPRPTASLPLIVQSSVVGLNLRQGSEGWGNYLVGVGRGFTGVSCRLENGPCPPPASM